MKDLKVCHLVNYAPGFSGMYGTVRDLLRQERKSGVKAEIIDDVGEKAMTGRDDIVPVPTSYGDECDIICWHHAMAEAWLNEPHRNLVLFLHGTPEYNFFTEQHTNDRVLSLLIGLANRKIPRAFVTMWKRHVPFWNSMLNTEVHYVPSWVDTNQFQLSPKVTEKDEIRVALVDYWRLSREPFGILIALDQLRRKSKKKLHVDVWGLTDIPNNTYKAIIQWMIEDGTMTLRGNTQNVQDDIYHKCDMVLSMSTEETRVVREAYACGVPVICGRNIESKDILSCDSIRPDLLSEKILTCHSNLLKDTGKYRNKLRDYAKSHFDVVKSTEEVIKIFNGVVKKHGSVNYPILPDGYRMISSVHDTADKIKNRLLNSEPTCYLRFGDGDLLLIAGADREKFHKNSPELQKELTEAFTHKEPGWIVSSCAGIINEGRMRPGLFGRFHNDEELRNVVKKYRPKQTLDNYIALAYKSVFEPQWFIDFLSKCVHGKKVLFIGGDKLCKSPLVQKAFNVMTNVSLPMSDAYYSLDTKLMDEIKQLTSTHDLCICAAGMATRVIAKRLWTQGFRINFIDIGSIADGLANLPETRTWLQLVGDQYLKNYEIFLNKDTTSIIIPTYGNPDMTIRCMQSIAENTKNYSVIWVDNGSSEEDVEKVKQAAKLLPDCTLIRSNTNLGFSKAVNLGLKKVLQDNSSKYVVLLNNDAVVTPNWLMNLIAAKEINGVDAIGPLTSENNPHSLDALRPVVSDLPKFTNEDMKARVATLQRQYGTSVLNVSNMVSFFCCLMSVETIMNTGFLDENLFAYGEDNDYCERLHRTNKKMGIALGVYVHHDHGVTSSKMGTGWTEKRKKEAQAYLAKKYAK